MIKQSISTIKLLLHSYKQLFFYSPIVFSFIYLFLKVTNRRKFYPKNV